MTLKCFCSEFLCKICIQEIHYVAIMTKLNFLKHRFFCNRTSKLYCGLLRISCWRVCQFLNFYGPREVTLWLIFVSLYLPWLFPPPPPPPPYIFVMNKLVQVFIEVILASEKWKVNYIRLGLFYLWNSIMKLAVTRDQFMLSPLIKVFT